MHAYFFSYIQSFFMHTHNFTYSSQYTKQLNTLTTEKYIYQQNMYPEFVRKTSSKICKRKPVNNDIYQLKFCNIMYAYRISSQTNFNIHR